MRGRSIPIYSPDKYENQPLRPAHTGACLQNPDNRTGRHYGPGVLNPLTFLQNRNVARTHPVYLQVDRPGDANRPGHLSPETFRQTFADDEVSKGELPEDRTRPWWGCPDTRRTRLASVLFPPGNTQTQAHAFCSINYRTHHFRTSRESSRLTPVPRIRD